MAVRPVFSPTTSDPNLVAVHEVSFEWHPGLSLSQAQKSIDALHASARSRGIGRILEISTKSRDALGRGLSALRLETRLPDGRLVAVESAFQGSKVFRDGGPFQDLYSSPGREAKTDARIRAAGPLTGFRLLNDQWPTEPKTVFFDWLYLKALEENERMAGALLDFEGFTDITFNPGRSLNCQARSAVLFVSLWRRGLFRDAMTSREKYLALVAPRGADPGAGGESGPQIPLFES